MIKYHIQAISSNLIGVLNDLARDNSQITEHVSVNCLNRQGSPIVTTLWSLPENVYRDIVSRAKDYQFVDFGKVKEGVVPRNVREHFPQPRKDFKFGRTARKGTIKGKSLLRRNQHATRKSILQGVH
jgi:hypothetical protein